MNCVCKFIEAVNSSKKYLATFNLHDVQVKSYVLHYFMNFVLLCEGSIPCMCIILHAEQMR